MKLSIELDPSQRKALGNALFGLGNILAASLLVGQFVATAPFRMSSFLLGMILFIAAYMIATKLHREEKRP